MQPVIKLENVTKHYGSAVGIENLDLEVQKGQVFGFLGPNGAGKSTTINMLIDFIRPTSGSIKIFGLDSVEGSIEIRSKLGFLASDFALDKGLTGWQQLEYFGHLRGNFDKKYITQLAERLECKLDKKFRHLSRGNKQKVGLIVALMHKPSLLIFDEPTSGLDPIIQEEFNKIILEQKALGVTTFISSHILSEVQEICDHVAFIRSGKLIVSKPLSEIMDTSQKQIFIKGLNSADAKSLISKLKVTNAQFEPKSLSFNYSGDINQLVSSLAKYKVSDVSIKPTDLESIFMNYYEDKNA